MKLVSRPPIVEVAIEDGNNCLSLFVEKMLSFGESLRTHHTNILKRPGKPDFDMYKSVREAASMVDDGMFYRSTRSSDRMFCYMLGEFPVGAMLCADYDANHDMIVALACNPGLSGCGGALLEHAVALSDSKRRHGRLCTGFSDAELGRRSSIRLPPASEKRQ